MVPGHMTGSRLGCALVLLTLFMTACASRHLQEKEEGANLDFPCPMACICMIVNMSVDMSASRVTRRISIAGCHGNMLQPILGPAQASLRLSLVIWAFLELSFGTAHATPRLLLPAFAAHNLQPVVSKI